MSKPTKKHSVCLVDDHPLIRNAMAQLIAQEEDLSVCCHAEDYTGALKAIEDYHPDVAVIDLTLEGASGLELIPEIRARAPATRILVLSMHDEFLYAERCLEAGALGYVMKNAPPENVIAGIRAVIANSVFVSDALKDHMVRRMVGKAPQQTKFDVETLSNRELEVFRAIGRGLTTAEIASSLHLSAKTVQTYREHIKTKLNLRNANELLQRAVQWVDREIQPSHKQ